MSSLQNGKYMLHSYPRCVTESSIDSLPDDVYINKLIPPTSSSSGGGTKYTKYRFKRNYRLLLFEPML